MRKRFLTTLWFLCGILAVAVSAILGVAASKGHNESNVGKCAEQGPPADDPRAIALLGAWEVPGHGLTCHWGPSP